MNSCNICSHWAAQFHGKLSKYYTSRFSMASPCVSTEYRLTWEGIQNSHVPCKPCTNLYCGRQLTKMAAAHKRTALLSGLSLSNAHSNCYLDLKYAYPSMTPTHALATPLSASTAGEDYVEARRRNNQVIVTTL